MRHSVTDAIRHFASKSNLTIIRFHNVTNPMLEPQQKTRIDNGSQTMYK